jgi:hypothetical protein
MSLIDDIKSDITASKKLRVPRRGLLWIFFCALPIFWLFEYFGKSGMALPILNCIAVFGFLIGLKWRLRRFIWFWSVVVILASLHVPLILYIPWTTKWVPAFSIAAIDSIDFCVMLAIMVVMERAFAGRQMERSSSSDTTSSNR